MPPRRPSRIRVQNHTAKKREKRKIIKRSNAFKTAKIENWMTHQGRDSKLKLTEKESTHDFGCGRCDCDAKELYCSDSTEVCTSWRPRKINLRFGSVFFCSEILMTAVDHAQAQAHPLSLGATDCECQVWVVPIGSAHRTPVPINSANRCCGFCPVPEFWKIMCDLCSAHQRCCGVDTRWPQITSPVLATNTKRVAEQKSSINCRRKRFFANTLQPTACSAKQRKTKIKYQLKAIAVASDVAGRRPFAVNSNEVTPLLISAA